MVTPYDWMENMQRRDEAARAGLETGSPISVMSLNAGILILTMKKQQRKVFEIYDRLIYSAIGKQADVEAVRLQAIDFAHQEGFNRSPDDVTIQRVVGYALSPLLKRAFGDPGMLPLTIRAVFAQCAENQKDDLFYVLEYNGEFMPVTTNCGVAGTESASEAMTNYIQHNLSENADIDCAIEVGLMAWALGKTVADRQGNDDSAEKLTQVLSSALTEYQPEAALMERNTMRESRFNHFEPNAFEPILSKLIK